VFSDLVHRLRALVRRGAVERELADELRFHLEHAIEKHVASGMSRDEAARRARLEFGGLAQIAEECRDARGVALIDTTLQDLRYGLRTMRRGPLFSFTATATIALATAAIATVGSLADTLLWKHLEADDAGSIVSVSARRGRPGHGVVSYPDYVAFRDRATTVTGLAAHYSTAPLFVAAGGNAKEVNGAIVSANYFPLFGLRPALGRFFQPEEDRVPDRDRVAVIGYDFWQSSFAASPAAVGSPITINGTAFTVIGVAPRRVAALTPMPVQLYIPTMMLRVGYRWCDDSLASGCTTLGMIGRLAPGRSVGDAAAEFAAIMPEAWRHAPVGENRGVEVQRPRGMSEDDQEPRLVALLGAVAIVLLIVCCANLGGLLGAQSAARQAEFAIRMSLGAGPLRIVRQVLTESLLLACAGGIGGLLLSRVFIAGLARMLFSMDDEGHPLFYDFSPSAAIVGGTLAAAVAAGVLFSVVPAIRAVRQPAARQAPSRSTARWSSGRWLLAAQAAVAVAMLATAALLAFSAQAVLEGRNYETSHVALMRVRPRLVKYAPDRAQRFQRQVIERLRAVPSVESVSMVGIGSVMSGAAGRAALPEWRGGQQLDVRYNEIGPDYFATLRTPLLAGREFDDRDTVQSAPVAIVGASLAARLWPDGQPVGATIVVGKTPRQVVGVAADVSIKSRTAPADLWVFTPFWQNPGQVDSRIAVRTAGDPAALLPELAREVHRVDPAVPIAETITLPIRLAGLTRPLRVGALFIGYAAALAMLLTAIGLYGALAFAVSRRTKEIGIRAALGASHGRLIGSIVGEGLLVVLTGAAAGVALALAASRVVSQLLYASAVADWVFYAAAVSVVAAVGFGASVLPARRAAAVDPMTALRQE
jgi:predicted permease